MLSTLFMKGFNTDSGIPPAEEQMMNTYHKNYDVIVVGAGHAVTVGWVERSETHRCKLKEFLNMRNAL